MLASYTPRPLIYTVLAALSFFIAVPSAFATGPLLRNPKDPLGAARYGNGGKGIPYNPTAINCGPVTDSSTIAEAALKAWADVPSSAASFSNNGTIVVTVENIGKFINASILGGDGVADGFSPVVFDPNREILEVLGFGSNVLGLATPAVFDDDGNIVESETIIACNIFGRDRTVKQLLGTMIHEFGHYIGLAHSQTNGNLLFRDQTGPSPFATFGRIGVDFDIERGDIETMYPFSLAERLEGKFHQDDIAGVSTLYPAGDFNRTRGAIRGRVLGIDGKTPVNGVNVIARNVDDPITDSVSSVSGDFGEQGVFTLRNLTPGARYAIFVDRFGPGGFSTRTIWTAREEFWNGENETNGNDDDPQAFETIEVVAGEVSDGFDIKLTAPPQGEPLRFAASIELPIGFDFEFCNNKYQTVFLMRDGRISFIRPFGSLSFTTNVFTRFSQNFPAISAALDPFGGYAVRGSDGVTYEQSDGVFRVKFDNVPFFSRRMRDISNSFEMVLREDGSFSIGYDGPFESRNTVIAGYTCGVTAANGTEQPVDLTEDAPTVANQEQHYSAQNAGQPVVAEIFRAGEGLDLGSEAGLQFIDFEPVKAFADVNEPNDTFEEATYIDEIPFTSFDTNSRFTSLTVGDVDFYRFCGGFPGQTLVIDMPVSTRGPVLTDSRLRLYSEDGVLLEEALDNKNLLIGHSRLTYEVTRNSPKCYRFSIESLPTFIDIYQKDYRYLVNVNFIRGKPVPFRDENGVSLGSSVEVPLPFPFPYYGVEYNSVFINGHGSIAFGPELPNAEEGFGVFPLISSGPPRISSMTVVGVAAGIYSARAARTRSSGAATIQSSPGRFVVRFADVTVDVAARNFTHSITLLPDGTYFMQYENERVFPDQSVMVAAANGKGSDRFPDSGKDFSEGFVFASEETHYEFFTRTFDQFDLHGRWLIFTPALNGPPPE